MAWLLIFVLFTGDIIYKPVRSGTECEVQAALIKKIWNENNPYIIKHFCKPDKNAA